MYQIPGQCFCMEQCGTADSLFLHPNTFCSCSHLLQVTFPSTIKQAMNSMLKYSKFLGITWWSARTTWKHKCFTPWQAVFMYIFIQIHKPWKQQFHPQDRDKHKSNYRRCSNIYSFVLYFNITLYLTIIFQVCCFNVLKAITLSSL